MGGSKSKADTTVLNESNEVIVSTLDYNQFNDTINETVGTASLYSNTDCYNDAATVQDIDFNNCKIIKSEISGLSNDAFTFIDFSCASDSIAIQDVAQDMQQQIYTEITSSFDLDVENVMDTNAESYAQTDADSAGDKSKSNTDVENIYNLEVMDEKNYNIQNSIINSINANLESESFVKCANQVSTTQSIVYGGDGCLIAGSTITDLQNNASTEIYFDCLNENEVVQTVSNSLASEIGVVVEADDDISSKSYMKTIASSSAIVKGSLASGGLCILCALSSSVIAAGGAKFLGLDKGAKGMTKQIAAIAVCIALCLFISAIVSIIRDSDDGNGNDNDNE
jgi:hypothetical protein